MFNGAQYPIVWYLFVVEDSPLANASTLAKAKSDITSVLSIIHIHSCYQSKRNNQSCLQNILLHLISSKKNYYYSYFHLILGKNSTAEKTKIPLAYSDYLHYFYIGLNLLFF